MKGTFTSYWSNGEIITTPAELDEKTGEVVAETSDAKLNNKSVLVSECFTDEDGNDYEVCCECHSYIEKTIMVDGIGKSLNEVRVCSDYNCNNGEGNL